MKILAIESSCDETAAAVVEDGRRVLSQTIRSQIETHALYGGVVPEIASRQHIESNAQLTEQALHAAQLTRAQLDAVAVTYAPGLIGALLVGVGFAKAAALGLGLPLIPVHHIRGHIAANYLAFPELKPPFLCLVVSGGHTLLVDVRDYTEFEILGSTRDDAAGEAFDKCARVLGLPYPGGAAIDRLAQAGDAKKYKLPRAKISGAELDLSFSGLKTAVINIAHNAQQKGEELDAAALAAGFCAAVVDALVPRVSKALTMTGRKSFVVAGGVAANSVLRGALTQLAQERGVRLYLPPLALCGDNAAMIGAQAFYEYQSGVRAGADLNAYATMPVDALFGI